MQNAERFCTSCGTKVRTEARFCPECGTKVPESRTPSPISGAPPSSGRTPMSARAKLAYTGLGTFILAGFFFLFASHISDQPHPVIEKQQAIAMASMYTDEAISQFPVRARVEGGKIIIPLSSLLEKKMVEFDYNSPTTVVPLLAYISNEGKLVTSIRFCEPCNSKSFSIEGKDLVCGNCGTRWVLNNLRGISGSCQKYPPAPIPSEVVGNEIRIDEQQALNWKLRI